MPSDQLFRFHFQKPEWLNSSTARSASVYLAGAIVSLQSPALPRFKFPPLSPPYETKINLL